METTGVSSVVISSQHDEKLNQDDVKEIVRPYVKKILPDGWECPEDQFYVNPTGRFVIGGPDGDTGLTGRKIIVDTYGGALFMVVVLSLEKIQLRWIVLLLTSQDI